MDSPLSTPSSSYPDPLHQDVLPFRSWLENRFLKDTIKFNKIKQNLSHWSCTRQTVNGPRDGSRIRNPTIPTLQNPMKALKWKSQHACRGHVQYIACPVHSATVSVSSHELWPCCLIGTCFLVVLHPPTLAPILLPPLLFCSLSSKWEWFERDIPFRADSSMETTFA